MRYSPYPEYKSSETQWIGLVPKHWDTFALKRKFRLVNGSTPKSGVIEYWDGDVLWITPADFGAAINGLISTSARKITHEGLNSCGTSIVPANSIVITTRAPIGEVAQAGQALCTNQGCKTLVVNASDVDERFVFFLIQASNHQLNGLGLGTTFMELSTDALGYYPATLPTLAEQKQISDFLDCKTSQIDALISKKRELIGKLKEQRIAIITQAVNKGLDPSVPMRDSGVDWLGQVPEHWDILRIGRMITLQRGVDITKDEQEEGDVPVVSSGGIASYHSVPLIKGPGVIVGRKGTAGSVHYIDSDYWPHDTTLYVKDFWGNHPRFIYFKLLSMNLASFDTGTANPTVNRNRVHPEIVSWPSVTEQPEIVSFLDRVTEEIDRMIRKVTSAIDRLTEYRTALITAATTGKIDVRNVKLKRTK